VLTIVFGLWLWLAWFQGAGLWLHVKLCLVGLLVAYHLWCGKLMLDFRRERNAHGHVWYRWFNEFPTVVLLAIVLLAVLKPW
jgi:putative membrane protein